MILAKIEQHSWDSPDRTLSSAIRKNRLIIFTGDEKQNGPVKTRVTCQCMVKRPFSPDEMQPDRYMPIRYLSRFFDRWAHETTYAYIGNKHFFTKACHHQTYQNSKISWQKIGLILLIKGFKNWSFQKMPITIYVPLDWYSSMKFFFRKIRIFFHIEKSLWKSEIDIFCQLILEFW